jgi:hypothetical protein
VRTTFPTNLSAVDCSGTFISVLSFGASSDAYIASSATCSIYFPFSVSLRLLLLLLLLLLLPTLFFSPVALQSLKDLGRLRYSRFLQLFIHMVGLLGRVISPSQSLYLHRTTQYRKTRTNIHSLSGIRTHDPSNQPAKIHVSDRTATVTGKYQHFTIFYSSTALAISSCTSLSLLCLSRINHCGLLDPELFLRHATELVLPRSLLSPIYSTVL